MTRNLPCPLFAPSRLRAVAIVVALARRPARWSAQTKITPPKNKYTPEQDVQIGQEAAAEVRQQYPLINDREIRDYLDDLGRRLVAATPARVSTAGVRVHLHAGQLEGDQRLRAARRADVRQSRHDRGGVTRRRSRRRHGARTQSRPAAAWHGQRHQGAGVSDRRAGRRHRRRGDWRRLGTGRQPGQSVRSGYVADEVQPRVPETGRSAGRADHGACGVRPARPRSDVRDHPGAVQGQRRA